jgi:hypothetical protein
MTCLRRRLRVLRALRLAVIGTPIVALAQGQPLVRGDVVLADDRTPASGAIVEVSDSAGSLVARTLTSNRGTFSLRLPRSGRYGARVLRIGFRPTVVPPFDVTSIEPRTLHVVLTSEPIRLSEVRVATEDACRIRGDSGKLVAQVWEETRKALTSTSISESGPLQSSTSLLFSSTHDAEASGMLWQDYSVSDNFTTKPFKSQAAGVLADAGYSTTDRAGAVWFAGPDADALISDEFAAGHCFRLVPPPRARPEWLGVAFRPIRDRNGIVEIAGTFWVDRTSAELRLLEYRYTNVPAVVERNGAGGRIEFARLASGDWLVNRWHIRTVRQVVTRTTISRAEAPPTRFPIAAAPSERSRVYLRVTGGEALSVARGAEELYAGLGLAWDAVLTSVPGDAGAAGATVEFLGSGYFAVADSAGGVHLDHLLGDRYSVLVSTRAMRVLGLPALRRTIEIAAAGRAVADTIPLPADDSLLAARCGREAPGRQQAVLFGRIVDLQQEPLSYDTVQIRWTKAGEPAFIPGGPGGRGEDIVTDELGRWTVCGLPRTASVTIGRDLARREGTILVERYIPRDAKLVGVEFVDRRTPSSLPPAP